MTITRMSTSSLDQLSTTDTDNPSVPANSLVASAKSSVCADCHKDGGDDCFECGLCGSWLHFVCANVAKKNLRPISENERILVVCKDCSDFALRRRQALSSFSALPIFAPAPENDRMTAIEKQLSEVVATLQLIAPAPVSSEGSPSGTQQATTYATVASKGVLSTARVITVDDLNKAREDEAHRRSLVIAGLSENGNDFDDVSRMVKFLDCSASVSEVFRMGRMVKPGGDAAAFPRLLKVHVASSSVVKSVLSQARRLKSSDEFKGVYVRRSMSLDERKQLIKLREECRTLNSTEADQGVKFVVLNEHIVKFINCSLEAGKLVGGARDHSWTYKGLN